MEPPEVLPRWEAKVSTKITNATANQIWPLVADFFNFHEWFPGLPMCYGLHGTNGVLGCVRYCARFSLSAGDTSKVGVGGGPIKWSKEKLTVLDHTRWRLTYEMVDGNVGLKSYVPDEGSRGFAIGWSFTIDPVPGRSLDDMVNRYEIGLQGMDRKMEAAF